MKTLKEYITEGILDIEDNINNIDNQLLSGIIEWFQVFRQDAKHMQEKLSSLEGILKHKYGKPISSSRDFKVGCYYIGIDIDGCEANLIYRVSYKKYMDTIFKNDNGVVYRYGPDIFYRVSKNLNNNYYKIDEELYNEFLKTVIKLHK